MDPEVKEVEGEDQPLIERSFDSSEEVEQTAVQAEPETESGELEVSIEGDSPPPEELDSKPFRDVRNAHREAEKARKAAERRAKELEAELAAIRSPKPQPMPEPSLDDPDVDYDQDKFREKTKAWLKENLQREEEAKKAEAEQQQALKAAQAQYEANLAEYNRQIEESRIANFQEHQDAVTEALSVVQQNWLLEFAEKKAIIVAALGTHPDELEKLKGITREGHFVKAIQLLESKVKTNSPRKPPAPEPKLSSAGRSVSTDARLKELQDKADKTGDSSEVLRFLRAQKKA